MTKNRLFVFFLLLLAFCLSFAYLTLDMLGEEKPPKIYNISVIVRGKNSDSWTSIKQGAEQAASEMNVDLSFITLADENDLTEQVSMLYRELDGGANAVIVSAADYEKMAPPIERLTEKIPAVCIESNIDSPTVASYITADNYAMGAQIGQQIIDGEFELRRVAILNSSPNCENIRQRYDGLLSELQQFSNRIEIMHWVIPDDTSQAAALLAGDLADKRIDVLVALEPSALEVAAQAVSDVQVSLDLYGIGNSGKIASFIEQGVINATVVQNDFGIGYLGVKAAVDKLEDRAVPSSTTVEHRFINSENMYDPENQRLLFPFIR